MFYIDDDTGKKFDGQPQKKDTFLPKCRQVNLILLSDRGMEPSGLCYGRELKTDLLVLFEDNPLIEFTIVARSSSFEARPLTLGVTHHPAGSSCTDAVVEAVEFQQTCHRTLSKNRDHKPTLFTPAISEFPTVHCFSHVTGPYCIRTIFMTVAYLLSLANRLTCSLEAYSWNFS